MKRYGAIFLFLGGCITFSAHGAFIESMNTLVYNSQNSKFTIDDDYFRGEWDECFAKQAKQDMGDFLIFHCSQPGYGGTCYYHWVVDKKTRLLAGWGFDEDKGDPKVCGIAG